MRITIDRNGCISCGLCVNICPDLFSFADDGKAEVFRVPVPPELENDGKDAADRCPVSVILVEQEG